MKKTVLFISIFTILVLLVLIGIREINGNYFKASISEIHQQSLNDITYTNFNELTNESTVIHLTPSEPSNLKLQLNKASVIYIKANELLSKENKKVLKNINGDIILFSDDIQISTNAWVILSRLGYENVRLLVEMNDETFQPDISAGLK